MVPVLAQMMDRGDMHESGWGWWWLIGLGVMLLLVAVVVVLIVRIASPATPPAAAGGAARPAEELLADRLARGEIDTDESHLRLVRPRGRRA